MMIPFVKDDVGKKHSLGTSRADVMQLVRAEQQKERAAIKSENYSPIFPLFEEISRTESRLRLEDVLCRSVPENSQRQLRSELNYGVEIRHSAMLAE